MNPAAGQLAVELTEIEMQPASQFQSQFQIQLPTLPPLVQSAYAEQSDTINSNIVDDCEQFGNGAFNDLCDEVLSVSIDTSIQDPQTGGSNLYGVIINIDGLNDCDEFDDGNNNADCNIDAVYDLGLVTQTNVPNVNPVGTNEVDYVTDDFLLNGCDETGFGDNNAVCNNTFSNGFTSITQLNDVSGTVGVNFVETNTVDILQGFNLNNDCD
jgi:hypothetical protein